MKWHFSQLLADQVETEVTQRDQFNNDVVDLSQTIVREAVQNSLDAAVDDPCNVKVNFKWVNKDNCIDPEFFKNLFTDQLAHANEAGLEVSGLDFDNPQALVIEDFGTKGLTGSINQKDDNNFTDFWRRHGKSHKTGKSRGRWGLGKLVFSTTSRLGVFFGLTQPVGASEQYLMGQTVLNLRTVDGKDYPPHAFFSDMENEDDVHKRIPVPVKDKEFVEEFKRNFSMSRTDETGLSVVIPFPHEDIKIEHMLGIAIENYFYPIITGQLHLQFNDIEINSNNVRELAKQYAAESFDQIDLLFDFIEDIYKSRKVKLYEVKPSWMDDKKLDEDDFDEKTLVSIKTRFNEGDLVGLTLPVIVKKKSGENLESSFSVFIKRPTDLLKGHDLYVRGGLTVPDESKFRERKALGAMIAEDEAVCAFLGDAENAAHTIWTTNTEKLRKNYRNPQPLVTVIKKSLIQLYDLLVEVDEQVDDDALVNFFWIEEASSKTNPSSETPVPPTVPEDIPRRKKYYSLSKVDGGFTIKNTSDFSEEDLPRKITIEAAYAVNRGNPFKKYQPYDFTIGKNGNIKIEVNSKESIEIISMRENRWELEIKALPFKLSATGFDKNRDLLVNTK